MDPGGGGGAVVDKDIDVGCNIAGEVDSTRDDRFVSGRPLLVVRQPARLEDDIVGAFSGHASGIRETVEMEGDARHAAFVEPPGDDRQHLATALQP